jgi:hypothetical protein
MKKPLLIVIIILVLILVLPFINLIRWTFQEKKLMNIYILDKTVPTLERVKHRSFVWILTNERFVKKEKRSSYSYSKDYYGFTPLRPLRDKKYSQPKIDFTEIFEQVKKNDALYYADTYGVFFNDWYKGINKSRRSRKLVGGLNSTDYNFFIQMQLANKLCISEYNTFDYPTPDLERYNMTTIRLGIGFEGWTGKYFSSLDTTSNPDFPIWMTNMYRKEYRKPWSFTKPGIVLLRDRDIVVLEEGTHLKNAMPYIVTDSTYCAKYGVINKVPFDGWFDIIDPKANNVISKFSLETTSIGDSILFENSLTKEFGSKEFPAVINDTINHRTFYFSGDFATNKIPYWTARFYGIEKLKGIFYSDKQNDTRRFFWLYYRPLINGIFSDYYKSIKSK